MRYQRTLLGIDLFEAELGNALRRQRNVIVPLGGVAHQQAVRFFEGFERSDHIGVGVCPVLPKSSLARMRVRLSA